MTIFDLPRWLIEWLFPSLPWVWVAVTAIGLVLLLVGIWRRKFKHPTCPRCRYDMRGSTGLTCPECGHTAKQERDLHIKPRKRWVLLTGMLLLVTGPYLDLVQYRCLTRESLKTAFVPTSVWVIGFRVWPDTAIKVIEERLGRWSLRNSTYSNLAYINPPRSDIRRLLYGPNATYSPEPTMPDWQLTILARNSYNMISDKHSQSNTFVTQAVGPTYQYMRLAEMFADDQVTRNRIVAGLSDPDPIIQSHSYASILWFQERAIPFLPLFQRLLIDEINTPSTEWPTVLMGKQQIWVQQPSGKPVYPRHLVYLERPIGESGPQGLSIASDWLTHPDPHRRASAIHILVHGNKHIQFTQELTDNLIDAVVSNPWDEWSRQLLTEAGMLAVDRALFHLKADDAQKRIHAIMALGIVFYDSPFALTRKPFQVREPGFREWAERVETPAYHLALSSITELAAHDPHLSVRNTANHFLGWHEAMGHVQQRAAICTRAPRGQMRIPMNRFEQPDMAKN